MVLYILCIIACVALSINTTMLIKNICKERDAGLNTLINIICIYILFKGIITFR